MLINFNQNNFDKAMPKTFRSSDAVRLAILQAVLERPRSIASIREYARPSSGVQIRKYVDMLVEAGYIEETIESGCKGVMYKITPDGVELMKHLERLSKARQKVLAKLTTQNLAPA